MGIEKFQGRLTVTNCSFAQRAYRDVGGPNLKYKYAFDLDLG